jgi:hypothetical protein
MRLTNMRYQSLFLAHILNTPLEHLVHFQCDISQGLGLWQEYLVQSATHHIAPARAG